MEMLTDDCADVFPSTMSLPAEWDVNIEDKRINL